MLGVWRDYLRSPDQTCVQSLRNLSGNHDRCIIQEALQVFELVCWHASMHDAWSLIDRYFIRVYKIVCFPHSSVTIIFDIYVLTNYFSCWYVPLYLMLYLKLKCIWSHMTEWSKIFEEIFLINQECFKHLVLQTIKRVYMNRSIPDRITYAKVMRNSFAKPLGMFAMASCFL